MTATITYTSKRRHKPDVYSGAEMADLTYTNWTAGNNATLSNDAAGNLKVSYNGTSIPYAYRSFTVVSGALYRVIMTTAEDGAAQYPQLAVGSGGGSNTLADLDLRKTPATDVDGTLDTYVLAYNTTLTLTIRTFVEAAGYALLGSVSLKRVSTMSHGLENVMTDDVSAGTGAFTAVNASIAFVNVYGVGYGRDDNGLSVTNSGANSGQAARTNPIPTVSGRQYRASCYYVPFNTATGNILVGTTYANGQLGSAQIAANAAALIDTSDGVLYEFNNSDDSWTYNNVTDVNNATYLSLTTTSTAGSMDRTGLSLDGYQVRHIAVRLKRTSVSWTNYLRLSYTTADHGISGSYYAATGVGTLPQNEYCIVVFDMWQLASGGTDWKDNTITGLRAQATDTNGATYDVDFIAVGNLYPLEVTFTATQSTAYITYTNENSANAVGYYYALTVDQIDSEYTLSPAISTADQEYAEDVRQAISLNGTTETTYYREDENWTVTTTIIDGNDSLDDYLEFLSSCKGGETFTIDLYGDGDTKTAMLRPGASSIQRVEQSKFRVVIGYRVLA